MNKEKEYLVSKERMDTFITNSGNPMKKVYYGKVLDDGTIELVLDYIKNTDEEIESFREETEIENILQRVNAGEVGLLNQREGEYIDCVGMPKTYAEVLQKVIDGKTIFDRLPIEIKDRFGNDFNRWFSEMGNEDWYVKSGFLKRVEFKEEEVKE